MEAPIVLSLGGSVLVPMDGIDVLFLEAFRKLILTEVKKGKRFIIVTGGGYTARAYQNAANQITKLAAEDVDWLGIHATRLNGHLLRALFRDQAAPQVCKNPTKKIVWTAPIMIAAGWKPGWSTDYVAVRLAKKYGARRILNLSNIEQVFDRDPSKDKNAKPLEKIGWTEFRKMVGDEWVPGANLPFDPIASKLGQKWGMEVVVARGKDLENLKMILAGKKFRGTTIEV